jgi:amphi-Trp domain-containing protein
MELIEVKQKERIGREEAAARLRELADHLARHNDIEFERGGVKFRAGVPDEVEFKFEFEIEDGATELEIELSW